MKKPKLKLSFLVLTIFGSLLFIEISLRLLFYFMGLELLPGVSRDTIIPNTGKSVALLLHEQKTDEILHYIPHPYWGHTNTPSRNDLNQQGFISEAKKQVGDNTILIHIYGGSFAEQLAQISDAESLVTTSLGQCPIKLVNRAISGGLQPQQLITATIEQFDSFDVGINIDGFNDANAHYQLGTDSYFNFQKIFKSSQNLERYYDLTKEKERLTSLLRYWLPIDPVLKHSAIANGLLNLWVLKRISIGIHEVNQMFINNSLSRGASNAKKSDLDNFNRWASFATNQANILKESSHLFYNFIQPNLYTDESKPLSPQEQMLKEEGLIQNPTRVDSFKKFLSWHQKQKFSFKSFQMPQVFSGLEESVYADECCHLNTLGYKTVWRQIQGMIEDDLKQVCLQKIKP